MAQGGKNTPESAPGIQFRKDVRSVRLKLRKPKARKAVQWESGTVDNEHMNKMKSKCCCIYEKPRAFDESSSDSSEEDCQHCFGHVEKRKKKHTHGSNPAPLSLDIPDNAQDPQPSISTNEPSSLSPDVTSKA